MRAAFTLIDLIFFACPREFRRAYRDQIRRDVRDRYRPGVCRSWSFARQRRLARALLDVFATGLAERGTMSVRDLVYALRSLRRTPLVCRPG